MLLKTDFFLGVKQPELEADHSPPYHGMVLS